MPRPFAVRDLLVKRRTTAPSIDFLKATRSGAAAIQAAEGDAKAELAFTFTAANAPVRTVACWVPASRQVLDDNEFLVDFIDSQLRDALQLVEDAQLLKGSGVSPNLNGLYTQAAAYSRNVTGDVPSDTIRRACTQVQLARGVPTGIVVAPAGLERLELEKDSEGRYLMSYIVADGNGRAQVWRVPTVVSDALDDEEFLVGDFGRSARLYDRQQAIIEISNSHSDYFTKNMVAILAEERLALAVMRPDLLVKGEFNAPA
jgi:HK97 family phage major capsid protein